MYIVNLLLKVNWISLLCILPTQDDICPLQLLLRRGCSRTLFIKIEWVVRSHGPVQIKAGLRLVCVKQWSSSLMSTNWQENDFGRTIAIITLHGKKNKCSKDRADWFYIYKESSISTYWEMLYHWFFIYQPFTPTCTEGVFTSTSKHYFTGYQIYVKNIQFDSLGKYEHWWKINCNSKVLSLHVESLHTWPFYVILCVHLVCLSLYYQL